MSAVATVASPSPLPTETTSPNPSSSASMAPSPQPTAPAIGGHRSRPSFVISYSQPSSSRPPPLTFTASNAGMPVGHDPNLPSGVSRGTHSRPQPPTSAMSSSAPATTSQVAGSVGQPPKQFVAPAHPQSHHLHSLPPREKTTRTLILDHTAWRQGRTRFAQGRCELGMKVRFKNPESSSERSEGEGKRRGFFIGTPSGVGRKRPSDFGEPPEIDVASSDEDGESDAFGGDEMERVRILSYGRKFRHKRREARKQARLEKNADSEESSSMSEDGSEDERPPIFMPTDHALHAPALAARAAGMEKVLNSMLIQRPSSPPRTPSPPPYAVQGVAAQSAHQRLQSSSNILPNGLRLRLSLVSLANDLFERQPSAAIQESPEASKQASPSSSVPGTPLPPPSLSSNAPPQGLAALAQVSSQPFHTPPTLPSFHTLSLPSASGSGNTSGFNTVSPKSPHPAPFGGASAEPRRPPPLFTWPARSTPSASPITPTAASSSHGSSHKQPDASISDSATKPTVASRPLPASWTDVTPRAPKPAGYQPLTKRAAGRSRDLYAIGCYTSPSTVKTINTFQRTVPTYSYGGTSSLPKAIPEYPIPKLKTLCPRHLRETCRICEPTSPVGARGPSPRTPSTRIGAGLLRKEPRGNEASGCVLADLLPRFLRLSALVAMELGREARGEEPEAVDGQPEAGPSTATNASSSNGDSSPSKPGVSTTKQAQPTRAWYALLCGLITRAVLEGYVARGWKGAEYAEILMGIGLGIKGVGTRRSSSNFSGASTSSNVPQQVLDALEGKTEHEPDEMPSLVEACKLLFSGLVHDAQYPDAKEKATRTAEQEYVTEMEERMSEFLAIPHACPDLATHLTGLSEKYPAEPVERAALQFCEAISKWRGKPELEMYKKSNKRKAAAKLDSSVAPLTLNSLLASTSAPHRPPIYKYFRISRVIRRPASPQIRTLKRQRSLDEDSRGSKKEKVDDNSVMDVDSEHHEPRLIPPIEVLPDPEWVGPYGV